MEQRGSWEALSTAQEFYKDVSVHSSCGYNRFPLDERDGLKDLRSARKTDWLLHEDVQEALIQ